MLTINLLEKTNNSSYLNKLAQVLPIIENALGTTIATWALHYLESVTPVDTGLAKSMWIDEPVKGGVSIANWVDYSLVLEEGLYPRVGKSGKTVRHEGRIYSTQAVGGMISPMLENPLVDNQLTILITEALDKALAE